MPLLQVNHRLRKESLDQLVGVVLRLGEGVDWIYSINLGFLTFPVEDDVSSALMAEFEFGGGTDVAILVAGATEHHQSLLRLP